MAYSSSQQLRDTIKNYTYSAKTPGSAPEQGGCHPEAGAGTRPGLDVCAAEAPHPARDGRMAVTWRTPRSASQSRDRARGAPAPGEARRPPARCHAATDAPAPAGAAPRACCSVVPAALAATPDGCPTADARGGTPHPHRLRQRRHLRTQPGCRGGGPRLSTCTPDMLGGYENTLCTPCARRGALLLGPPPGSPQTPPAPWGWCSSWVGCAGRPWPCAAVGASCPCPPSPLWRGTRGKPA